MKIILQKGFLSNRSGSSHSSYIRDTIVTEEIESVTDSISSNQINLDDLIEPDSEDLHEPNRKSKNSKIWYVALTTSSIFPKTKSKHLKSITGSSKASKVIHLHSYINKK